MTDDRWLCLRCRAEAEPSTDLTACPNCGSTGVPASTKDRVSVSITWHELRVLVMWAEFWATAKDDDEHREMKKVVYGIADALQLQHMDKAGLTFASEIADLREEFGNDNVQVIREDGSEIE